MSADVGIIFSDTEDVRTCDPKDTVIYSGDFNLKGSLSGLGVVSVPQEILVAIEITSVNTSTNVLTSAGHGLSNGDTIYLYSDGFPAPLDRNTLYYVINKTTDTFQLSLTSGGAAIDITTSGGFSYLTFERYTTVRIAHGLGYQPMATSYWNDEDGIIFDPAEYYPMPTYTFTAFFDIIIVARVQSDADYTYLSFVLRDDPGQPNVDIRYSYYIFIDKGKL